MPRLISLLALLPLLVGGLLQPALRERPLLHHQHRPRRLARAAFASEAAAVPPSTFPVDPQSDEAYTRPDFYQYGQTPFVQGLTATAQAMIGAAATQWPTQKGNAAGTTDSTMMKIKASESRRGVRTATTKTCDNSSMAATAISLAVLLGLALVALAVVSFLFVQSRKVIKKVVPSEIPE